MDENTEGLETQNTQEGEAPEAEALTPEEIAEMKKRAEVSSQNFERAKKAEAEKKVLQEQVQALEAQLSDSTGYTDPDSAVLKKIADIEAKFNRIEEEKKLLEVLTKYPALGDKQSEFEEYRKEFPTSKLDVAAKAFLVEHDLLGETPKRKGLEPARGGKRTAPESGKMSADDVKRLRDTNYKEYMKLVRAGKINL